MPQTYIRTSLASRGLNSSFSPVSELWILSMRLEPLPCGLRGYQHQERCEFRTMRPARQGHSQGHEQLCTLASGAFLENLGKHLQVAIRLLISQGRRGEKLSARRRDNPLLIRAQRRKFAPHHGAPRNRILRQYDIVAYQLDEFHRVLRAQPGADIRRGHPRQGFLLPVHQLRLLEARRRTPEMLRPEMCRHLRRRQPAIDVAGMPEAEQLVEHGDA